MAVYRASMWDEKSFRESCVDIELVPVMSLERGTAGAETDGATSNPGSTI